MGLIDSHAHLTCSELSSQVAEVLERAVAGGVDQVITVGTTLADTRAAIELSERYPGRVHAAGGVHPHETGEVCEDDVLMMAALWDHPRVVAAGEIGLDYHYHFAVRETQRRVFARQLELAASRALPIVIHSREAFDDTVALLVDHGFAGRAVVFHCFTGTAAEADRLAEYGWRVSFSGIVTFKKSQRLREVATSYPVEELMIETDSPYVSPEPVRLRRPNEPAHARHIARFLADLRGMAYEELVERTAENTRRFFSLEAD